MVKYVSDHTGRFSQRPHYEPKELDLACEKIVTGFLKARYGEAQFPISTDDLTRLVERDTEDLDLFADLSCYGSDVEGVTEFQLGKKPLVKVSSHLSSDKRRENRLRTTLTHEYGHVHFHAYLWDMKASEPSLWENVDDQARHNCRRHDILTAKQTDWMEWQAGYACGALLMPVSFVKQLVGAYLEEHDIHGPVLPNGKHGLILAQLTIKKFQVSEEAAMIRLRKLGIVGDTESSAPLFS